MTEGNRPGVLARLAQLGAAFAQADGKLRWIEDQVRWRLFHRRLIREAVRNEAFDRQHGTDTAAEIDLVQSGVPADLAERGNGIYRALWEHEFHSALDMLDTDLQGFTFVDLGSGKGKLLMLAAFHPFARIVGVEFSPGLHDVAQDNLRRFRAPGQRCTDLRSVLGDALAFPIPDGPVVCFIFNSFDPPTLRTMLARLEDAVGDRASPAYVIYANLRRVTEMGAVLHRTGRLKQISRSRTLLVLGNHAACAGGRGRDGSTRVPRRE